MRSADVKAEEARQAHPVTPDGRYFVVRGRLWRRADPSLTPAVHDALVAELMAARRALRHDAPAGLRAAAALTVDVAKRALGERGPVWWTDGSPDYNRKMVRNTPYAAWFDAFMTGAGGRGSARPGCRSTSPP